MNRLRAEDFETNSLDEIAMIEEKNDQNQTCSKNPLKYFSDFCKNTHIYGFKYLSDPRIVRIEKLYWLIFIFISFYFSISTMVHVWTKWYESPVTVFAQNYKSIREVPFPAVTICPEIKIRQRVYNFTDYYHKMLESKMGGTDELDTFSDMSLFCDNHLHLSGKVTTDFKTVYKNLIKVSPSHPSVFMGCKWSNLNNTCENLFTPFLTEEGLCFTFNMLNEQDIFNNITSLQDDYTQSEMHSGWTVENGYPRNTEKYLYPRRTTTPGTKGGLFILLKTYDQDIDYVCRGPVQGFRIAFHQPSEVPKIGTEYFRAPLNQEIVIALKPHLVTTAQGLKNYDPHHRQCFFSEERRLKFFRIYDQQNCRTECLANFTLQRCDCVAFHMPHEKGTKICGSGSNMCMFEAEQELLTREAEQDPTLDYENEDLLCDCLPACTSLAYHAEMSQADFKWTKVLQGFKTNIEDFSGIHMTRLTIFFRDMHFSSTERNKLNDRTEVLAQFGGLLAFFCGVSFLSLAEIIYFFLLKIICSVKRIRKLLGTSST